MPVPDIFVIGAMRAGTTGFCADLGTHPAIVPPHVKEAWVLNRALGRPDIARALYRDMYTAGAGLRFDGSTGYSMIPHQPTVADLAKRLSPDARIVYLVREPVARAISQFRLQTAWGIVADQRFDEAVERDDTFVDYGRYWMQLEPWLDAFGRDAVSVIVFEEYVADREAAVGAFVASLGLDPRQLRIDREQVLNRSEQARSVPYLWRRLLMSGAYTFRVRRRIPHTVRERFKRFALRETGSVDVAMSAQTRARIVDGCRADNARLAEYLRRPGPIWG